MTSYTAKTKLDALFVFLPLSSEKQERKQLFVEQHFVEQHTSRGDADHICLLARYNRVNVNE